MSVSVHRASGTVSDTFVITVEQDGQTVKLDYTVSLNVSAGFFKFRDPVVDVDYELMTDRVEWYMGIKFNKLNRALVLRELKKIVPSEWTFPVAL